jgi:hypothetical protein
MKNIHIVPTTQASRLVKSKFSDTLLLADMASKRAEWKRFNIYITSDEEIKEGEWFYSPKLVDAQKLFDRRDWRKIILTTDVDLIKDGVQAIDDEFLEWFIKNPSCEFIRVGLEIWNDGNHNPIIIIPKEEPKLQCKDCNDNLTDCTCTEDTVDMKQETMEYDLLQHIKFCLECKNESQAIRLIEKYGFVKQEQGKNKYSEVFEWLANKDYLSDKVELIQKEFEEFKKK